MSECKPESGQPSGQPCAPRPDNPPRPIWQARVCITVECPPGTVGESVEVCATATSEISQADADAKALAAAEELADLQLNCVAPQSSTQVERVNLDLTMLGSYDAESLDELMTLDLTLFGDYDLPPNIDEVTLDLDLTGEYEIVPFEELQSLDLALYPLSEYRLQTLFDEPHLHLGLLGSYDAPTIPGADEDQQALLDLNLTGLYDSPLEFAEEDEAASLDLTLSGSYTLQTVAEEHIEAGTLDLNLTGAYVLRVVDLGSRTERKALKVGLAGGSYT